MNANPSNQWTPEERLQVIAEHVAHIMNNRLVIHPEVVAETMDIVSLVATHSPEFLEKNRSGLLRLTQKQS